ncbi:MAG: hypothetical protein M9918_11180 [Anaerolineae bacterium]|nr:hypothetical protein [Anaerolineae bacterium]
MMEDEEAAKVESRLKDLGYLANSVTKFGRNRHVRERRRSGSYAVDHLVVSWLSRVK